MTLQVTFPACELGDTFEPQQADSSQITRQRDLSHSFQENGPASLNGQGDAKELEEGHH